VWLIVGLGNPGPKYERNRHNIGFRVVDRLAQRCRASFRSKFGGQFASDILADERVSLLEPMEYMNVSGHAVSRAAQFLKVEPPRIVVVHDEIDFPFGRVRVKRGGGHGGHNGLRSIIAQVGDKEFGRVRCGVGRPTREDGTPADKDRVSAYVLSDFPANLAREVDEMTDRAADAVEAIVRDGLERAMNEYNADVTSAAG